LRDTGAPGGVSAILFGHIRISRLPGQLDGNGGIFCLDARASRLGMFLWEIRARGRRRRRGGGERETMTRLGGYAIIRREGRAAVPGGGVDSI